MPRTKKVIQFDDEVKVTKKRKTVKLKKPKQIVTKDMISEAAYYKAEQRSFEPGHEKRDWFEAEVDLKSQLTV